MIDTPAIEIKNLRKTYSNGFEALKGIDLQITQGDFFALLGPNGAGKSTTIGLLTSIVQKTSGTVSILGYDLDREPREAKALLGVVPQEINLNIFETPLQILRFQAAYYGLQGLEVKARTEFLLKKLELWEKRNTQVRMLSGGMKRRLMIARGLIHSPKILILDEPTAGVDVEIRQKLWAFLVELNLQGLTILLTTHYLEEAESLCRGIAIIDHGHVIAQTTVPVLLKTLDSETLILESLRPIAPGLTLQNYEILSQQETQLEIKVYQNQHLTGLLEALKAQNIEIVSVRSKSNRLEQLFLNLVQTRRGAL